MRSLGHFGKSSYLRNIKAKGKIYRDGHWQQWHSYDELREGSAKLGSTLTGFNAKQYVQAVSNSWTLSLSLYPTVCLFALYPADIFGSAFSSGWYRWKWDYWLHWVGWTKTSKKPILIPQDPLNQYLIYEWLITNTSLTMILIW